MKRSHFTHILWNLIPGNWNIGLFTNIIVWDIQVAVIQIIFCRASLDHNQRIFNYRLSRVRRIIENSFGILAATWRVYQCPLALQPEQVKSVVKATCVLQNLIQTRHQCSFTPDSDDQDGSWRQLTSSGIGSLTVTGQPACTEAKQVHEKFKDYFNTVGQVPWQERMIGN